MGSLPDFEDRSVRKASLRITNAGDGLSDALTVSPKAYHHGEEITLVLTARITQVNHRPVDEKDAESVDLVRVHTAKALDVVEVDRSDVSEFLAQAADYRRRRQEQESGQTSLLDGDPSAEAGQGGEPEPEPEPEREPEPFGVA